MLPKNIYWNDYTGKIARNVEINTFGFGQLLYFSLIICACLRAVSTRKCVGP